MCEQDVRGQEHHFKKDEEVEDIASEECAIDANQLQLEDGVEMSALLIET